VKRSSKAALRRCENCCRWQTFYAKNLLICTGSEAFVPPIPGLDRNSDIILTNREILELKEKPESLVVIGGGVIGMEFASFFNSLGTKVTVIEMLPEILTGMDTRNERHAPRHVCQKRHSVQLSSKVVEIKGNEVVFEKDGQKQSVSGDKILVSVGRRPVTQGFGLENLGVELFKGGIKVDEKMRTNIPNVYAAGDVTGFSLLAHTASREGEVVVNNLTGREDRMRYNAIPGVVYTNPEISGVGLTEEAAKAKGIEFKIASLPMAYAGRFIAENEGGSGLCKVLVGAKYGEVLGVHMLGNPSSEMIYGACMAIEAEMTLKELEEVVFPHPTVSEIFKETIMSYPLPPILGKNSPFSNRGRICSKSNCFFAKQLRDPTEAENKKILGFRFKRQHPILYFIADFYCHQAKLVVEVDGGYHQVPAQYEYEIANWKS
jgi:dihydrolipoamide dehydrogenase